ncbi:hypothetical protein [Amycolatopsis sp. NPDC054798]
MERDERVADAMLRPGVYGIRSLEQALSFFVGFDAATEFELLGGFTRWLSEHGGPGPNLAWPHQAAAIVDGRAGPEAGNEQQVQEFFALVREFFADRS